MFLGSYLHSIIKQEPELMQAYDGFVWYPNTLSISSITSSSICPILEGYDYTIDKLNKDTEHTIAEKVTASSKRFIDKVKANGFDFTANKMVYADMEKNAIDAFIPSWHGDWDKWNAQLNINVGQTKDYDLDLLWQNAIFYASPLFLKPKIYNKGNWFNITVGKNENSKVAKPYNFLRLLPYISDTTGKNSNFIYYHCKATHLPWNIITDNGELIKDVPAYDNQKWFLHIFAKWIAWMKENNVYDNTKIVLLSDYAHFLEDKAENFGDSLQWDEAGQMKISANNFWRLNALLMVKDYNSTGRLKKDWRLMSNADAPAIVFEENDPTKGEAPITRTLPVTYVEWVSEIDKNKNVEITHHFLVKDNIYNSENWIDVKE